MFRALFFSILLFFGLASCVPTLVLACEAKTEVVKIQAELNYEFKLIKEFNSSQVLVFKREYNATLPVTDTDIGEVSVYSHPMQGAVYIIVGDSKGCLIGASAIYERQLAIWMGAEV